MHDYFSQPLPRRLAPTLFILRGCKVECKLQVELKSSGHVYFYQKAKTTWVPLGIPAVTRGPPVSCYKLPYSPSRRVAYGLSELGRPQLSINIIYTKTISTVPGRGNITLGLALRLSFHWLWSTSAPRRRPSTGCGCGVQYSIHPPGVQGSRGENVQGVE